MTQHKDVSELNGLVVKEINVDDDQIMISTECGRSFLFHHYQDCCESVRIWDSVGNLKVLEGKRLVSVECDTPDIPDDVAYEPYEWSQTWTEITFKTTEDTIISRWIGESNGYYSESVDFEELVKNA